MNKIVNIIVDASGSMAEDDKNAVIKYLLNGIRNISETVDFHNIDFVLYQWGKISKKIDSLEKAKLKFLGNSSTSGLEELKQMVDKNQPLIFISDGNFDIRDKENIKKLSENIVTIFIGVDANRKILQDISTDQIVYSVIDFMQAICEVCK